MQDTVHKRRPLKVLLLVVLAAAIAGVPFIMKPSGSASAEDIRQDILSCAPGFGEDNQVLEEPKRECMTEVMFGYLAAGANDELWEALRVQAFETPYFYFACHSILHKVGERAYKEFKDMAALVLENNSDVCGTGFIMGGLDAFGADDPSPEEFQRVARACASMDGPGFAVRLRGMCEHSMGHVAWKSTKELSQAAERCALIETEMGQLACGDGVVMQIYQPVNDDPTRPIEAGFEELDRLCESWPDVASTRGGCYGGAGYIYTRPLYLYDAVVRNENRESTTLTDEQRAKLLELAMFAVDKCKAHTWAEGVDKCLRRAAWAIPGSVHWDPTLVAEICANFENYQDQCRVSEEPY